MLAVLPVPGGLEPLACLGERGTGFGGAGAGVMEGLRQLVDDGWSPALQRVVDLPRVAAGCFDQQRQVYVLELHRTARSWAALR
nr:hypothetical protein [Mycolicibacter senuensis]